MTFTTRLIREAVGLSTRSAGDVEAAQAAAEDEEKARDPGMPEDDGFELEERMDRPEYWWRPWDVTSRYVSVGGADEPCERGLAA